MADTMLRNLILTLLCVPIITCTTNKSGKLDAQPAGAVSPFFPTATGAQWIYHYTYSPGQSDTTVLCSITGKRTINNKIYQIFNNYPSAIMPIALNRSVDRLLRYDVELDAIVEWNERVNRDVVIFRFTEPTLKRQAEYSVEAGVFPDIIIQEPDPQLRDAGTTQVYAQQIGLIKYTFMTIAGGGTFELVNYNIPDL